MQLKMYFAAVVSRRDLILKCIVLFINSEYAHLNASCPQSILPPSLLGKMRETFVSNEGLNV